MRLGQELIIASVVSCNELSVVVVMSGLAVSFCHMMLCFLPLLFGFLVL